MPSLLPHDLCHGRSSCSRHSISVFPNESTLHIRWPTFWIFSFSISPSNEYSELIYFSINWFGFIAAQWILKSFPQHHNSKPLIIQCVASFMIQLSHLYMITGKIIALSERTLVSKMSSLLFNVLSRYVIAFQGASVFSFHGCNYCLQ